MPSTSIFIYGSCVSRDAFNFAEEGDFQIVDYYARSSLVSALAPPLSPAMYPLEKITSNFRRRSVERDISKTLLHALAQKSYHILLIDFVDERLHLVKVKRERERERERERAI